MWRPSPGDARTGARRFARVLGVAQIRGLDRGIAPDRVGLAGSDDRTVDHHGDVVGDAKHRVHVVLDEQDCVAPLEAGQERQHSFGFLGPHAGQRLVEQQHVRRGGEAHRDFELALLSMR